MYRHNGAGEMLVFSAADFEDFREPRPDLAASLEDELYRVVRHLAENRWPFRIHGTYDESISRFLDVFERVNAEFPLNGLNWFIDHAETVTQRNLDRIKALGGGIAVQHRMAYQGEDFVARYGAKAAEATPPIHRMLATGIPIGMGTDATRVASYNPWIGIYWLATGKTVGGLTLYPPANRLSREEALRLYTEGSSWFSTEHGRKGAIVAGQYADFAVLPEDMITIADDDLKNLKAVMTVVGGEIVYGAYFWELFQDTAKADHYIECFMVESWLEHLRQHERISVSDRVLEDRIGACLSAGESKKINHYVVPSGYTKKNKRSLKR